MVYLVNEPNGTLSLYDESSNLCEFDLSRDDIYGKNALLPMVGRKIPCRTNPSYYTIIPVLNKEWLLKTQDELRRVSKEQLRLYMKKELAGKSIGLYDTSIKEVKQGIFEYEYYKLGIPVSVIDCYVIDNIGGAVFMSEMSVHRVMSDVTVLFTVFYNRHRYFTYYDIGRGGFNNFDVNAIMSILFIRDTWYCKIAYLNSGSPVYIKLLDLFSGNAEIEYVKED